MRNGRAPSILVFTTRPTSASLLMTVSRSMSATDIGARPMWLRVMTVPGSRSPIAIGTCRVGTGWAIGTSRASIRLPT